MVIASFHLVRYPRPFRTAAASRMLFDRPLLRSTTGLRFAKTMGTARGRSTSLSADLDRWALFAVWDEQRHLDTFLQSSQIAARWYAEAEEVCTVRLGYGGGHGSWNGVWPFTGAVDESPPGEAPVAVFTRATIRLHRLARFYRMATRVSNDIESQPGLLRSIGAGEWPVGRLATFSIWHDTPAMTSFAYGGTHHADAVGRTRAEVWFREEMFVRFRVLDAAGSWDGSAPLSPSGS